MRWKLAWVLSIKVYYSNLSFPKNAKIYALYVFMKKNWRKQTGDMIAGEERICEFKKSPKNLFFLKKHK